MIKMTGFWRRAESLIDADVSDKPTAFTFRAQVILHGAKTQKNTTPPPSICVFQLTWKVQVSYPHKATGKIIPVNESYNLSPRVTFSFSPPWFIPFILVVYTTTVLLNNENDLLIFCYFENWVSCSLEYSRVSYKRITKYFALNLTPHSTAFHNDYFCYVTPPSSILFREDGRFTGIQSCSPISKSNTITNHIVIPCSRLLFHETRFTAITHQL